MNQAGTYWYHSHSRFQEQVGLYGPIVIEPRDGERFPTDREHVVLLSDWTDADPERIYATLKKQSNYYNFGKPTAGDFLRDVGAQGLDKALAERRMWNRMRMDPSDLADVSATAYTYLMNGAPPARNWTALFARGEKVRLRFINGASMTFFDVRIPGLAFTVVAADGQDIEPVTVDEFRIGPAETCDVIVTPSDDRAYTIFAQAMDRSGYARGTLAPRIGMEGEVPPLDPRPLLTMRDMMGAMDHGAMGGMDHRAMKHGSPIRPRAMRATQRIDAGNGRYGGNESRCDAGFGGVRPCGARIRSRRRHARRHAAHESRRSGHRPSRQRSSRPHVRGRAHDRRADFGRTPIARSSCT